MFGFGKSKKAEKAEKVIKSSQEQAIASWVNYLNQVRLDRLTKALNEQNANLDRALNTLNKTFETIKTDVIERNRGGNKGMHGFIAEIAECGIGNARREVVGKAPNYVWINDNGPADLLRDGVEIQQKFVNTGNHLSLQAILHHFEKYPDFLKNGGKYQIPADHYQKINELLAIPKEKAYKLPTSTGEFSLKQWQEVQDFFETTNIKLTDIEPSTLSYNSVQTGMIEQTIEDEKRSIKDTDKSIKDAAYEQSKPTVQEGVKAGAISAVTEGGLAFCTAIIKKTRNGKSIKEFTNEDWQDILKETGISTVKGGIRGVSIYALTNYTATPAAVANAIMTASFGIAQQAYLLRSGSITKDEFIHNSEVLCVDVSVSALSSFIGQAVIPVPILGSVMGNAIGTMMCEIAKDTLQKNERQLVMEYFYEIYSLSYSLEKKYQVYIKNINDALAEYSDLLNEAFVFDAAQALEGSVHLSIYVGVPIEKQLKTVSDIDNYFMN